MKETSIGEFDKYKDVIARISLKKSFIYQNIKITSNGDIACLNEESFYIPNKNREIMFSGKCVDVLNNFVAIKNNSVIYTEQIF